MTNVFIPNMTNLMFFEIGRLYSKNIKFLKFSNLLVYSFQDFVT